MTLQELRDMNTDDLKDHIKDCLEILFERCD